MKRFKVRYGSNVKIYDLPQDTTIGDIKCSDIIRADLGFGDNVNILYNGVALPDSAIAPEFIEPFGGGSPFTGSIVVETACNKKEQN